MAIIGSKGVSTAVINIDGVEHVINFVNGLATVPKIVKKHLLERMSDLYFDPRNPQANDDKKFSDEISAIQYYVAKIKSSNPNLASKLCSVLKGEYETIQGELLSGKFTVKQQAVSQKSLKPPEDVGANNSDADDNEVDCLVGTRIDTDTSEKKKKKISKKDEE